MKVDTIYLRSSTIFSKKVSKWLNNKGIDPLSLDEDKRNNAISTLDGLVIFNENQHLPKDIEYLKIQFDQNQKPVYKVDINGTLRVGVSNFALWIEQNKCKKMMLAGSDQLADNPNLERYLLNM
ncbi:MAG: hypothetical protein P8I93_02905 [Crocinitomicaceae bacterium]|nr:hypothetical protein [Crocinitomicaceae bacterium]